ncbi:MAG: ketose-bisphosphate aldolase [Nonlabens sp.]|jgi:ketose-bisphosphate aldolase
MLQEQIIYQRNSKGSLIAFNVQTIEHLHVLSKVSEELNKPVIAQFSSKYIRYWENVLGMKVLIDRFQRDKLYFHLDHCLDLKLIRFCIDLGFAGVMFDGSSLNLEENLTTSRQLKEYINTKGKRAVLEVELGSITGVEDDFEGAAGADYYSMEDLERFAGHRTFDLMALAIGNAHGQYASTGDVKPLLLKSATTQFPELNLVLHGGTGLPVPLVLECIQYGVVKINVSTDLKIVTQTAMREFASSCEEFNQSGWSEFFNERLQSFYKTYIKQYTK